MDRDMRKKRQHEQGFTLAFTIMLTVVLSLAAVAIMAKVFVSLRHSGFTKEHQNTMDAAVIGLNMAIDELSPGMDRMRNAVWTSAVSPYDPAPDEGNPDFMYPPIALTQTQLKSDWVASTDTPVRQLSLAGNIRNWEGFANWGGTTTAEWNRGWEYVASASTPYQFFDVPTGQTGKATVSIGNINTTGAYWYKQIEPKPPTLADGGPDVPTLANGTKIWPNTKGGIYGNEYPYGLFCQPVLRKVYQVRQNPLVRVAVYVRMSLQDYYGAEVVNGKVEYKNRHLDGRTIPIQDVVTGMDNASASYDGRNFLETNAVTFSIFAVSEGTGDSKGVRIHQAVNITLGGAEYISGRSKRIVPDGNKDINANGLENPDRLHDDPGANTTYLSCLSPYFAPALDTPSGNSQLTAFAPINGQVYPASADLSFRFDTRAATEQVVFLYEHIKMATDDLVVFLIEQIPTGLSGKAAPYWRRRLLYDYPDAVAPLWETDTGQRNTIMMFNLASYSPTVDPFVGNAGFPSMLYWANRKATPDINTYIRIPNGLAKEEHFYNRDLNKMFQTYTDQRYPYTTRLDRFGNFTVGTQSAGDFGILPGNAMGDVVVWNNPPLLAANGTRLANTMPWQGPTVPISQAVASVSYVTTTWPKNAWSTIWANNGGGVGIPFTAATWSVL